MAKKDSLKPLYLILSEESFLRDQAVDLLKERVEKEGPIDFNFDRFDASIGSVSDIIAAAETMPFASPYRLVLVTNIDKLTKEQSDVLARYAARPNETTVLALVGTKLNKGTELLKQVKLHGDVLDRKAPNKRELPEKVVRMFAAKGLRATRFVADALINAVGTDLTALDSSIDKLAIYAGDNKTIEISDIIEAITVSAEVKTWEFINDLADRNAVEALAKFQSIVNQNNDAQSAIMPLNAAIQRLLRDLIVFRSLIDRGVTDISEYVKASGQFDWKAKITKRQADKISAKKLEVALRELAQAEHAIKSGSNPVFTYEQWIIRFVSD